jgi:tRNA A-37 threonylcarbamoyl transferase component Bud32
LLRQALESKHYQIWKECFEEAIKAYEQESKQGKAVTDRLKLVEKRGRYKH